MLVLGIETAGSVCSVGLAEGATVLTERTVRGARIHSVRLIPLIEGALCDAGKRPADLEGLAVSAGPGSFTGLRIGMAVAKALAHALDRPVAGVSSLDVLAYPLRSAGNPVMVIVPARRGEVYGAVYTPESMPHALAPPEPLDIAAVAETARRFSGPLLFTGEAADMYRQELAGELGPGVCFAPSSLRQPRGAVVAEMGAALLARGGGATAFTLRPEYIRPPAIKQARKGRGMQGD